MVTADELGNQGMSINSFSFNASPGSDPMGPYEDFTVLMGHTTLSQLGETYDSNWSTSGTQVLFSSEIVLSGISAGNWFDFPLDTPFVYDGSSNLLIEITWNGPSTVPSGQGSIYTWTWTAGENRTVTGNDPSGPTGYPSPTTQYLQVEYDPLALEQTTFAGIKASF